MFKIIFIKNLKSPQIWILNFLLPIILFGISFSGIMGSVNSTFIFLSIFTIFGIVASNISIDIHTKRLKHYLIIKKGINNYFFSLYWTYFIFYIVSCLLVIIVGFLLKNFDFSYLTFLMIIPSIFFSYTFAFLLGWFVATFIKSPKLVGALTGILLLLLILFSGILIPTSIVPTNLVFVYFAFIINPFGALNGIILTIEGVITYSSIYFVLIYVLALCFWIVMFGLAFRLSLKVIRN